MCSVKCSVCTKMKHLNKKIKNTSQYFFRYFSKIRLKLLFSIGETVTKIMHEWRGEEEARRGD